MIKTDQFRKKLKIEIDGDPWIMLDVDFVRPGKGQGFVRTKLRNLISGNVVERTFKSNEVANPAAVDDREMQFLYEDPSGYTFMNNQTYDQVTLSAEILGDCVNYLYDGLNCNISFFNDVPIGCELPNFVELEVTECEPGVKGNSAQNALKPAVVSTGYRLNVPLFLEQNTWIKVDTRTGAYAERVKRPEGR